MGYNKKVLRAIDRELKDRHRSKRYSKSLSATNSLFAPNYLFSKPSKRRIYNPNAKYFKHGGSHEGDPPIKSIFDPRYKKYFKIANDNYKIRQLLKEYDKNWNDSIIDVDNKLVKPDSILFKKDHRSVVDDLKSLTGKDLRTEPRPYKIKDSGETFTKNFDSSIFKPIPNPHKLALDDLPWGENREEEDKYRKWVVENYPEKAKEWDIDDKSPSSLNNKIIRSVFYELGPMPDPIQPSVDEVEDIEPEIEIEKLDIIQPKLLSSDTELPELIERDEVEGIDYERKFGMWLEDKAQKDAKLKTFFKYKLPEFFNDKPSRTSQYYRHPKRIRAGFYNKPIENELEYPEGFVPRFKDGGPNDPLPAEYLKSEGFVKATNQDLDSLLRGFNTDGYDSHWYEGGAENYGVTSDQLRAFAGDHHPKSFVNAAAYAKAMNELAVNAGGKNVSNIPFADNPMVMRTDADDLPVKEEYVAPQTLQEQGYINETGTNAVNQDQSYTTGLAKRYGRNMYDHLVEEKDGGSAKLDSYAPGGAYGPGDGLKKFIRDNNVQASVGYGKLPFHGSNYTPQFGLNAVLGSSRKGFWDLGATAGGDKNGFSGGLTGTYYGPFMSGNRHMQGKVGNELYYDQGTLGYSGTAAWNFLGGNRNIGNKRDQSYRPGTWTVEGGPFLQVGVHNDLSKEAPSYLNEQQVGTPIWETGKKIENTKWDFTPGAGVEFKWRPKKVPLTFSASGRFGADLVESFGSGAAKGHEGETVYENEINTDASPYIATQYQQVGEPIVAVQPEEEGYKPEYKWDLGAKIIYDIPYRGGRPSKKERKIEELKKNDPYYNPGVRNSQGSLEGVNEELDEQKDGGPTVKQRRGVRKNPDGSVSSHLMRAEYIPEIGWVAFPSLFQDDKPYADDQQNWVDMSWEEDWMKIYEEAERRGEVYYFGEDKEAALAFGMGSWKDQLPEREPEEELYNMERARELGYERDGSGHLPSVDDQTGMWLKSMDHPTSWKEYMYGQLNKDIGTNSRVVVNPEGRFGDKQLQYVELTDEEADNYRAGGYVLEEMQDGGGKEKRKLRRLNRRTKRNYKEGDNWSGVTAEIVQPGQEGFDITSNPSPQALIEGFPECPPFHVYNTTLQKCVPMTEQEKADYGLKYMQDYTNSPQHKIMLRNSIKKDLPNATEEEIDFYTNDITGLRKKLIQNPNVNIESVGEHTPVGKTSTFGDDELRTSDGKKLRLDYDEAEKRGLITRNDDGTYASGSTLNPDVVTETDLINNPGFNFPLYIQSGLNNFDALNDPTWNEADGTFSKDATFYTLNKDGEHSYVYPHEFSHQSKAGHFLIPRSDKKLIQKYSPKDTLYNIWDAGKAERDKIINQVFNSDEFKKEYERVNKEHLAWGKSKGVDYEPLEITDQMAYDYMAGINKFDDVKRTPALEKLYKKHMATYINSNKAEYTSDGLLSNMYNAHKDLYENDFDKFLLSTRIGLNVKDGKLDNNIPYDEFLDKHVKPKAFYKGFQNSLMSRYGYLSMDAEVGAKLDAIRMYGKAAGIYDPMTEPLTKEKFIELKDFWMKQNPKSKDANQFRQMLEIVDEEELFEMLNTISKSEETSNILDDQYAQEGGSVELGDEVDEATMKRLKKLGYTFKKV